jgi:hypothetical protein
MERFVVNLALEKGFYPKFELDSNENKRKKMVAIVVDSD